MKDYIVIREELLYNLELEVDSHLKDGFSLVGGIGVSHSNIDGSQEFLQAMVRGSSNE